MPEQIAFSEEQEFIARTSLDFPRSRCSFEATRENGWRPKLATTGVSVARSRGSAGWGRASRWTSGATGWAPSKRSPSSSRGDVISLPPLSSQVLAGDLLLQAGSEAQERRRSKSPCV